MNNYTQAANELEQAEYDNWHQQQRDTQRLTQGLYIALEWALILACFGLAWWLWACVLMG